MTLATNSHTKSSTGNQAPIRPITIIEATRLSKHLGLNVVIASETFQHTGSFKFRGALNVACHVSEDLLITSSSGNFGMALAYACLLRKKSCIVVMPSDSAIVKVEGVREYGGQVEFVDVRVKSRTQRVAELKQQHPHAYVAMAADDDLAIEGYSSLGKELATLGLDTIVVPVGGGGLMSGTILGAGERRIRILGAEPLLANDAARSLQADALIANVQEQQTIADGARALSLGRRNWEIIRRARPAIVAIPEQTICEAVRLLFRLANLKVEPTGALGLAALITQPELFRDQLVCCVVSGGNVDAIVYRQLLAD